MVERLLEQALGFVELPSFECDLCRGRSLFGLLWIPLCLLLPATDLVPIERDNSRREYWNAGMTP